MLGGRVARHVGNTTIVRSNLQRFSEDKDLDNMLDSPLITGETGFLTRKFAANLIWQ